MLIDSVWLWDGLSMLSLMLALYVLLASAAGMYVGGSLVLNGLTRIRFFEATSSAFGFALATMLRPWRGVPLYMRWRSLMRAHHADEPADPKAMRREIFRIAILAMGGLALAMLFALMSVRDRCGDTFIGVALVRALQKSTTPPADYVRVDGIASAAIDLVSGSQLCRATLSLRVPGGGEVVGEKIGYEVLNIDGVWFVRTGKAMDVAVRPPDKS
jgi:hypothetical protein